MLPRLKMQSRDLKMQDCSHLTRALFLKQTSQRQVNSLTLDLPQQSRKTKKVETDRSQSDPEIGVTAQKESTVNVPNTATENTALTNNEKESTEVEVENTLREQNEEDKENTQNYQKAAESPQSKVLKIPEPKKTSIRSVKGQILSKFITGSEFKAILIEKKRRGRKG